MQLKQQVSDAFVSVFASVEVLFQRVIEEQLSNRMTFDELERRLMKTRASKSDIVRFRPLSQSIRFLRRINRLSNQTQMSHLLVI